MPHWRERLWRLIEQATGLVAQDSLDAAIEEHVAQRLSLGGLKAPDDWFALLASGHSGEWSALHPVLVNGQTFFFRDRAQLQAAVELLRRRAALEPGRVMRIWSAGCSTGEEPYSLAILCRQAGLSVEILATDLSELALGRARRGLFDARSTRDVPVEVMETDFVATSGGMAPIQALRDLVRFECHNLMSSAFPLPASAQGWDLITCRNVFIYFSRRVTERVVQRFSTVLAREGALVLGATESLQGLSIQLVPILAGGRIVYGHTGSRLALSVASGPPARRTSVPAVPNALVDCEVTPRARMETSDVTVPDEPRAGPLLDRIARLAAEGEIEVAREELQEAAASMSPTVAMVLTLGHLCLRHHRLEEALAHYRKAEAIDPLSAEVHLFEGLAYRKLGRLDAAEGALGRALFLAPPCWQASYLLAGVYQRLGKSRAWQRELRRTLQLLEDMPHLFAFDSHGVFVGWYLEPPERVAAVCRRAVNG